MDRISFPCIPEKELTSVGDHPFPLLILSSVKCAVKEITVLVGFFFFKHFKRSFIINLKCMNVLFAVYICTPYSCLVAIEVRSGCQISGTRVVYD